jgi:ribonuclease BN (tRNA processing enzyme)
VHEACAQAAGDRLDRWQRYHGFHTSAPDLVASPRRRPRLLVLYHQLTWSATPEQMLTEIRSQFDGRVVYGKDLEVY